MNPMKHTVKRIINRQNKENGEFQECRTRLKQQDIQKHTKKQVKKKSITQESPEVKGS